MFLGELKDECADSVIDVPISEIILHENYDSHSHNYDIALIRLARAIQFTDFVRPICLPFGRHMRNKDFDGLPLVMAGFGNPGNGMAYNKQQIKYN